MYNQNGGVIYTGVQSSSPAGSGNADNGLSVDTISGNYVLGNAYGDVAAPAQLLDDREIQTNGFALAFTEILTAINSQLLLSGGIIQMFCDDADSVDIVMLAGNDGSFNVNTTADQVSIFSGPGGSQSWALIRQSDIATQIGPLSTDFNNATLQVSGTFTSRMLPQNQASGTITVNRETDSGKLITNNNATALLTVNLPNMVAVAFTGFHMYIAVTDTDGIRITAFSGATIRIGGTATAAGGSITSNMVGSTIHLVNVNTTLWVAMAFTGSWSI